MRELSTASSMTDLFNTNKRREMIEELAKVTDELIDQLVKYDPETLWELKAILLLRDPDTNGEIEEWKIKDFIGNKISYHILAIHSLYLQVKRGRETNEEIYEHKLGIFRQQAEEDIILYRISKKKDGYSLSGFGQITKDLLMDRIRSYPDYNLLIAQNNVVEDLRYKENFLLKLVNILERRSYELIEVLKVSMKGV